jgi:hypothetical protein
MASSADKADSDKDGAGTPKAKPSDKTTLTGVPVRVEPASIKPAVQLRH